MGVRCGRAVWRKIGAGGLGRQIAAGTAVSGADGLLMAAELLVAEEGLCSKQLKSRNNVASANRL